MLTLAPMLSLFLPSAWAGPEEIPKLPQISNPPAEEPAREPLVDPAQLVVDAKVPVEVLLGGTTIGELFYPGLVQFQVAGSGAQVVRLYTNGRPVDVPVEFIPGGTVRILVGRTGVTVDAASSPAVASGSGAEPATGPAQLELRFVGAGGATVRLDSARHVVGPGRGLNTTVPLGRHALSVRSADGTVIWAAGELFVDGPLVVQIAEGRLPEVSGAGRFVAGGG